MKHYIKCSLGIDVSKDKWDFNLSAIDIEQKVKVLATKKFNSTEISSVIDWVEKRKIDDVPLTITMEATGVYYEELAWHFHIQGYRVSVVLPNKSKKYLEGLGLKSKNDKTDAKGLARMGAEQSLEQWKPLTNEIYSLRQLTRHYQSLQEEKTKLTSQLHSIKSGRMRSGFVEEQLEASIKHVGGQINDVTKAIEEAIKKDTLLNERVVNITKIKGLSVLTVATVIAETNGFAQIKNIKQLESYAGYDVVENASGKRVGKTKISKKGNSRIRRILHFAGLNTVRYQQGEFKNLYERVYDRTRIKMKGYVAVQRKVLGLIYALYKKNKPFNPDYHKMLISGSNEKKPLFHPDGNAIKKMQADAVVCLPWVTSVQQVE